MVPRKRYQRERTRYRGRRRYVPMIDEVIRPCVCGELLFNPTCLDRRGAPTIAIRTTSHSFAILSRRNITYSSPPELVLPARFDRPCSTISTDPRRFKYQTRFELP